MLGAGRAGSVDRPRPICHGDPVNVQVFAAGPGDKPVMRRLLEFYRYDFSEFDGSDVDEHGAFGYRFLDLYWTEEGRHPFLFKVDGRWAGLALVRSGPPLDMAEFFVLRKFRRSGIGREAARALFARFPGAWTVRQQRSNPVASTFWRAVIPFEWTERTTDDEVIQEFVAE